MSRHDISWVMNTHRYRNREDQVRYQGPQVVVPCLFGDTVLTNAIQPVIEHVIHIVRESIAHTHKKSKVIT
jgi:hypothetical protein